MLDRWLKWSGLTTMRDKRNDAFGAYPLRCTRLLAQGFTPSDGVVQRVPPPKAAHTANGFVGSLVCCVHHEGELAGYDPNDRHEWMK